MSNLLKADANDRFARLPPVLINAVRDERASGPLAERLELDAEILRHWIGGHGKFYTRLVHELLKEEIGARWRIAELFGLTDPSSISKAKKNESLTDKQLWLTIIEYPEKFLEIVTDPALQARALVEGYLEAISHVRNLTISAANGDEHQRLTADEFNALLAVLGSDDWLAARASGDPDRLEQVAMRLFFNQRSANRAWSIPELEELIDHWAFPFLICADSLREQ